MRVRVDATGKHIAARCVDHGVDAVIELLTHRGDDSAIKQDVGFCDIGGGHDGSAAD